LLTEGSDLTFHVFSVYTKTKKKIMNRKKRNRVVDILSWILLPVLIMAQGYVFFKRFTNAHPIDDGSDILRFSIPTFILCTISIIVTMVIIDTEIKISKSRHMSIYGYYRDRDENDFRRRKRNVLKMLFATQAIILIIVAVLKI